MKCDFCKAEYAPGVPKRGPVSKYCSVACRRAFAMRQVETKCEACGVSMTGQRGRRYCEDCRHTAYFVANGTRLLPKACKQCGEEFTPSKSDQEFCGNRCAGNARRRHTCVCGRCGETFTPKATGRTQYCSRECAYAYKAAHKVERASDWTHWYGHDCKQCGVRFIATRAGKRAFCSPDCRAAWARASAHEWYMGAVAIDHKCADCGASIYGQGRKRCDGCAATQKRALHRLVHKPQNRARRAGVLYAPVSKHDVVREHGTRCWLCGERIDMDAAVPSPLAMTMDHVVPLSLGGWHDLINLRPAHFSCNVEKGDTYAGQLMLRVS